jgi:acyl carrier protein
METNSRDFYSLVRIVESVKKDSMRNPSLETRLMEDAGFDSIALMELAEKVQREMDVRFLPEDYSFVNLRTIGSVLELVLKRLTIAR